MQSLFLDAAYMAHSPNQPRCLLIVEPEALLKWSLVKYLSRWFEILVADSKADVENLMAEHDISALVVSDALPDDVVHAIEMKARAKNPDTLLVRTVTDTATVSEDSKATYCIEKPFSLSEMAELLGVSDQS